MHDVHTFGLPGSSVSDALLLLVQTGSGIISLAGFSQQEKLAPFPPIQSHLQPPPRAIVPRSPDK